MIISTINLKGGVGKTTTAIALATATQKVMHLSFLRELVESPLC